MTQKKAKNIFGYTHSGQTRRKRPGRHAKRYGKRIPRRKPSRGQG